MRHHTNRTLAALIATLAMAFALSSTTSARVFSFSNWNFRVVWRTLEFVNSSGFGTVRCPITIEGSFHSRTISKVEKALIGHATRAIVGAAAACTGGEASVDQETLPWHITYNGFRGILPRINSIRVLVSGPSFQINTAFTGTCTVIATPEHEARGEALLNAAGEVTNDIPDETVGIPTNTGCLVAQGQFRAAATDGIITLLGNTTRIRVTLI